MPRNKHQKRTRPDSDTSSLNESFLELRTALETMESELFDLRNTVEKTAKELIDTQRENKSLKEALITEQYKTDYLQRELNDVCQYSRKNNVRVFGVNDTNAKEDASISEQVVSQIIRDKLKINLAPWEIEVAHRLGHFTPGKSRPIIVRFQTRKAKNKVMASRRNLKGSRISISDDLTQTNVHRLHKLKELSCVSDAWYNNGKFYAKHQSGKIIHVLSATPLNESLFESSHPHPRRTNENISKRDIPPSTPASGTRRSDIPRAVTNPVLSNRSRTSSNSNFQRDPKKNKFLETNRSAGKTSDRSPHGTRVDQQTPPHSSSASPSNRMDTNAMDNCGTNTNTNCSINSIMKNDFPSANSTPITGI